GRARYALGMARLGPAAAAYARHRDRGPLKAALVAEFLTGSSRDDLSQSAERFATERSAALLRPDALRAWRRWRQRKARLVIVTASPQLLVAPFGHGLGAEAVIGTGLAFNDAGLATGALDGPNCRGSEKVARLQAAFGDDVRLEAAYGDSDGDTQMLAIADERGLKVFSERP
ncbi:MAG TPA: HAD-IB family hydrolase, partial [Caulobacteraceae bacterium]